MSLSLRTQIIIFVGAIVAFIPFLGSVHLFDWDEINFAEAAREMVLTGEYIQVQIGYEPFWEKPPFFIWLQAMCMHLFGISEFAARLPNAFAGAISLTLLYRLGATWRNHQFGVLWAGVYAASFLPQFYFRSGIIDPWFNLFIFLGIERLIKASETTEIPTGPVLMSGIWTGLAVLTKGPAALVLVGAISFVFLVFKWKSIRFKIYQPILFLILVGVIGFSYFLIEAASGNTQMVLDFIDYNFRLITKSEAGHGQPFYYHAVVLLAGCFPMSLLFLFGLRKTSFKAFGQIDHHRLWMIIMFWVVLGIFSAVKTKIIHYSSLTYFPMAFIAAELLYSWLDGSKKPKFSNLSFIAVQGLLLGVAMVLAANFHLIKNLLLNNDLIADKNAVAALTIEPNWNGLEWFVGVVLIVSTVVAVTSIRTGFTRKGIIVLLSGSFATVWLFSILFMPRIEEFTQKGVVDFYKNKAQENAYCEPLYYHSYAHLYYGERSQDQHPLANDEQWLLKGEVDRPVYFAVRLSRMKTVEQYNPHLVEIGRWGGFVFLTRNDAAYPFLSGER